MKSHRTILSRRTLIQAGGAAAGANLLAPGSSHAAPSLSDNVYTRIGVEPFINLTATYTINGGAPMLAEVRQAMEEAAQWAVNLDELMEKAGARIAELLQAEAAIVTAGCAAALSHATAACIAGADPEKMKRLPGNPGPRHEVIIPKQSRNPYDHAFRVPGGRLVEVDTREEFLAALGRRTALVAVLGTAEAKGKMRLEEIVEAAHRMGVPVLVDAAAELPVRPNPFLSRGADLVAYSGGKILRGPQSAGLLLGRKDLVQAAWWNSSPHHAYGRSMKVSKEEVIGMLTAVELFVKRGVEADYRTWESWFEIIARALAPIAGVSTRVLPPAGASPFPVLEIRWDPARIPLTGDQLFKLLLDGKPRIMSHAGGEGHSFILRPVAMRPEHPPVVARRLAEIFSSAPAPSRTPSTKKPPAELTGIWDAELTFACGRARHTLIFEPQKQPDRIGGLHVGSIAQGALSGSIDGDSLTFRSALLVEGMRLEYGFNGRLNGREISGQLDLGEFGTGSWIARKRGA